MAYADIVLADTPFAYYRLGEASGTTMVDSSGNSRDGTYVGAPTLGVTGAIVGDPDTAMQLVDNSSDYGHVTGFPSPAGEFAVEAWVYLDAAGASEQAMMERGVGGTTNTDWILFYEGSKLTFRAINDAGQQCTAIDPTIPSRDAWHHVVGVQSANVASLYVDGVLAKSVPCTRTTTKGAGDLFIGRLASVTFYGLDGLLDEATVYHHALTPSEVEEHYLAGIDSSRGALGFPVVTATPHALTVLNTHHMDVSNAANVRRRTMRCEVDITYPVAPVPAGVSEAEQRDAVVAYPLPDMDNGRPT